MPKSIIEQGIQNHIQTIPIKGVGSHVKILYNYHVEEIIQKTLEEAENRIDEELQTNYDCNKAKQILNDCFGVGK